MGNCVRDTQNQTEPNRTEWQSTVHHITSHHNTTRHMTRRPNVKRARARTVHECVCCVRFYLSISIASLMAQCDIPIRKCCQFTRRIAFHSLFFTLLLFRHPNFPNRIESTPSYVCIYLWCVRVWLYMRKFIHKIIIKETIRKNESSGVSLYRSQTSRFAAFW